jgi:hypothetical protein
MVSFVISSFTIYLSLGERPVKTPVLTATAPVSVTAPFSYPFLYEKLLLEITLHKLDYKPLRDTL